MRPSQLKHPVAVLRKIVGLGQKEFAELIGVSASTIQSIELGPDRLRLSEHLASAISRKTGAGYAWLMRGDPQAPPLDTEGQPYTKQAFEKARFETELPDGARFLYGMNYFFRWYAAEIGSIFLNTQKNGRYNAFLFRLNEAIYEWKKDFGFDEQFKTEACGDPDISPHTWEQILSGDLSDLGFQFSKEAFKIVQARKRSRPLGKDIDPRDNLRLVEVVLKCAALDVRENEARRAKRPRFPSLAKRPSASK